MHHNQKYVYLYIIEGTQAKARLKHEMKSKIAIGTEVQGKFGKGIITKIITKSTGYVEVDFSGNVRKEMAFNLTDMNGEILKSKPVKRELTAEQILRNERSHSIFMKSMNDAVLADNFLPCQIESGNYNTNLIF